ncbi:alpha/beta hydrolase domain-containing protein [Gordonia sp. DT30]|uniref:alpha/beta hydrolase domain-containing protein n=1 Tax=Gordonia sp. DT30 TaxID=3416546 RepID=UPI003CEEB0F4
MSSRVTFTELTDGHGHTILSATPGPELAAHGYDEREYAAAGRARRYGTASSGELDELASADFTTRILVRRPRDDADFNGHVVVEWFNVSSGMDAAPEYTYLAPEFVRSGYAWIGVSAQYTGIEGGDGSVGMAEMGMRLADKDPDRYGTLHHPGDGYSYDIFGSIGLALAGSDAPGHPLTGLTVRRLLAVGESQSAMALTTYANHFANRHNAFHGILIHSRSMGALPLGDAGGPVDIDEAYRGTPVRISTDLAIPVFVVQTETDVLTDFRYVLARQPDSPRLRVWEVAGTSHADHVQIGEYESMLGCPDPVNRGQQRFVLRAALHHLRGWVDDGTEPPTAPPLLVTDSGAGHRFELDEVGNVRDGVRTPCVDVATQVLSGVVEEQVPRICVLFGRTTPLPPTVLADLYPNPDVYLEQYTAAADTAIGAGFVRPDDRAELLADARTDLVADADAFR